MPHIGVKVSDDENQSIERYWRQSFVYKNKSDFVKTAIKTFMEDNPIQLEIGLKK